MMDKYIDWNEISRRGLLVRINREVMHPLGLAVARDPATGKSPGALDVGEPMRFVGEPEDLPTPLEALRQLYDAANAVTVTSGELGYRAAMLQAARVLAVAESTIVGGLLLRDDLLPPKGEPS